MNKIYTLALVLGITMVALPAFAGVPITDNGIIRVPEPSSLILMASAIGGVAALRRFRKN